MNINPTIFLSYAREDGSQIADKVSKSFIRQKYKVFLDRQSLTPGEFWKNQIKKTAQNYDILLVIFTPIAAKSEWVKKEVDYANKKGKHIIPCLYHSVPVDDLKKQDIPNRHMIIFDENNIERLLLQIDSAINAYKNDPIIKEENRKRIRRKTTKQ